MVVLAPWAALGLDAGRAKVDQIVMFMFTVHGFSPFDDVMAMTMPNYYWLNRIRSKYGGCMRNIVGLQ